MSTIQTNHHSNAFSPILLSPNSTSNTTITNHHLFLFDNSDQGSVDSDYTSLGSSKFYGNGGSNSSLHRQGRSQSIDELVSTTTTIPTRHFNATLNVNKLTSDPLQFVKIHPNHDLIERAQEQLTILESRKRFQDNFKFNSHHSTPNKILQDDNTDWSKAVENWRLKRQEKRKQSLTSNRTDDNNDEPSTPSLPIVEQSPPPRPVKTFEEPKPTFSPPSPPRPPTITVSSRATTNASIEHLSTPIRKESKSPSPQRIKGPGRIHEIIIQKPVEVRGFGFKLDDGQAEKRTVFISSVEDGSPADKAGLCVDDEVIAMNDENIEHMTFEQVRKILKERNLRGSIKMKVKTYEDTAVDNIPTTKQTVTIEHNRTPSPPKPVPSSLINPVTPSISTSSSIRVSSTTPPNVVQSPVYTFLPYSPLQPSISTTDTPIDASAQPVSTPPLNIFAPKPFRSTASINLDTPNSNEKNLTHSSPIEAFRKMLDPSTSIPSSRTTETTRTVEQTSTNLTKSTSRDVVNTLLSNPTLISSNIIESSSLPAHHTRPPPPPLSSVESLLHGTSDIDRNDQLSNESPMAQVRSSVEKQMNQLQQELLLGFPNTPTTREQRPVAIPVDLTHATISGSSTNLEDSNHNHRRSYSPHGYLNENTFSYSESNHQTRPVSSCSKRSVPDIPANINRPLSAQSVERTINELRVSVSSPPPYQHQKKVTLQIDEQSPPSQQQRVTNKQLHSTLNQAPRKSHYEDRSWIGGDEHKTTMTPPSSQDTNHGRTNTDRRSASLNPYHRDVVRDRQGSNHLSMFHYGDHSDELHHQQHPRPTIITQVQRDVDPSIHRHYQSKHRTKSPIRTTINSNNNRVLSVSGKLRCSKCNDELGQGSAMVIESLGLYYHIECFRCFVCNIPLSSSFEGTDVRVRNHRLHCQNCFSDENGGWRSNV